MNASLISVRYAKAFFSLGKDNPQVIDNLYEDATLLKESLKASDELKMFLTNALIKPGDKKKVFHKIFGNQFHDYTIKFVNLIVENHRSELLSNILLNFISFYRDLKGIKSVSVVSAVELKPDMRKEICEIINQFFSCKTDLECKVDKDIIGGLIVIMDGKMVDGSVMGQLRSLRKKMLV